MSETRTILEAMLDMVDRFNRDIVAIPIPKTPERLRPERKEWALIALQEELKEFEQATELEDEVDALIDLTYFALGRLVEMGVAPLPVFQQVHDANMKKFRGALSKRPGSLGHDAVKPDGWTPPNLQPYLQLNWEEIMDLARIGYIEKTRQEKNCAADCCCGQGDLFDEVTKA